MEPSVKTILDDYCAAWNDHDIEKMASFFAEDGIYESVSSEKVSQGKEDLQSEFNTLVNAIPDMKLELPSVFISGNMANCEWRMTGTHKGDFPDLPATGRSISQRGDSVIEMSGNKIKRQTTYIDMLSFLRKLVPAQGSLST